MVLPWSKNLGCLVRARTIAGTANGGKKRRYQRIHPSKEGRRGEKYPDFPLSSALQFPISASVWLNLAKLGKGAWETVEQGKGTDMRTNRQWGEYSIWTEEGVREWEQNFVTGEIQGVKRYRVSSDIQNRLMQHDRILVSQANVLRDFPGLIIFPLACWGPRLGFATLEFSRIVQNITTVVVMIWLWY